MDIQPQRITIFAGHYGSGKTNLAINYAIWLKNIEKQVAICDLDIVNPYFRTTNSKKTLDKHGITLITSKYAVTNTDVPAISSGVNSIFEKDSGFSVLDVGGDRGALVLGRYAHALEQNGYEMFLVFNKFRPMTREIQALHEIKSEIEGYAKIPFTGLVNNPNLGGKTELSHITESFDFARDVSEKLGLELKMTAVNGKLLSEAQAKFPVDAVNANIFPIKIYSKENWKL